MSQWKTWLIAGTQPRWLGNKAQERELGFTGSEGSQKDDPDTPIGFGHSGTRTFQTTFLERSLVWTSPTWEGICSQMGHSETTIPGPRERCSPASPVQVLQQRWDWFHSFQVHHECPSGRRRAANQDPQEDLSGWLGERRRGGRTGSTNHSASIGAIALGVQKHPVDVPGCLSSVSSIQPDKGRPWLLLWLVLWTRVGGPSAFPSGADVAHGRAQCMERGSWVDAWWHVSQRSSRQGPKQQSVLDERSHERVISQQAKGKSKKGKDKKGSWGYPIRQPQWEKKGKGQGDKGGKGKGKTKSKPSDWASNWAFKNPNIVPFCRDYFIKKTCQGQCGLPTIVQLGL